MWCNDLICILGTVEQAKIPTVYYLSEEFYPEIILILF